MTKPKLSSPLSPLPRRASAPPPLARIRPFQANHPRRAEINARLAHENFRINRELRAGLISPHRAHMLHREVHAIRMQERAFAESQNGHITRHQQRLLNREENAIQRADRSLRRAGEERRSQTPPLHSFRGWVCQR